MNKINLDIINEIKSLIFFDEKWKFPDIVGYEIIEKSIDVKITDDIKVLINFIINQMNKESISTEEWEDGFDKILYKWKNL